MGKLTNVDKMAIQGGVQKGMSATEIAKALGRPEKTVQGYIDGELDDILNTITKARIERGEEDERAEVDFEAESEEGEEEEEREVAPQSMRREVHRMLKQAGLIDSDIAGLIKKAVNKATTQGVTFDDSNALFKACVSNMRAGQFFTKKTQNGRDGVAIMNSAVSAKMDDARKRRKKKGRMSRGSIYNPRTGKVE